MSEAWLSCQVSPGLFSNEYAVSGQEANGEEFSLFVPTRYVRPSCLPGDKESVPGQVRVDVWEKKGDQVLVRLPGQTLERGIQFVTVPAGAIGTSPSAPTPVST
jgi:hypothetical protein